MPASASRSAIAWRVAWRMFVLAPWPRTSRWVARSGRTSRAETSPFSGVARNFSSFSTMIGPPSARSSSSLRSEDAAQHAAQGKRSAFCSVAREAAFATLQRAAGTRPIS